MPAVRIAIARFVALTLTALTLGLAFCHVVEMPVKLTLTASEYLVTQKIYGAFGAVRAVTECGAILATGVLAFL
jgi:hypothetical protein